MASFGEKTAAVPIPLPRPNIRLLWLSLTIAPLESWISPSWR